MPVARSSCSFFLTRTHAFPAYKDVGSKEVRLLERPLFARKVGMALIIQKMTGVYE
jgi:hypothetical protein